MDMTKQLRNYKIIQALFDILSPQEAIIQSKYLGPGPFFLCLCFFVDI